MASLARAIKESPAFMHLLNAGGRRLLVRAMRRGDPKILTVPKTLYAIERRLLDYLEAKPSWGLDTRTPDRYRQAFNILRDAWVWLRDHEPPDEARHYNRKLNTLEKLAKVEDVRSFPIRCYYELTSRCNLRCQMCGQSFFKGTRYTMPRQAMDLFAPIFPWCDELDIFGYGEALLVDYVGDLLGRIPPHVNTKLVTNGILLTPENNRMLVDRGLKTLFISLDAIDPQTYLQIRGVDKLEAIKENIRDLIRHQRRTGARTPEITLTYVAMRRNIEQLPGFVRLAAELGVGRVVADYLTVYSEAMREQSLFYDQERSDRLVDEARAVAAEVGVDLTAPIKFSDQQAAPSRRPRCFEPWEFVYIRGDGLIQPCCTNPDPMAAWTEPGDFGQFWNSPAYHQMRRTLATPEQSPVCRNCSHVCFRDNRKETSHIRIIKESEA